MLFRLAFAIVLMVALLVDPISSRSQDMLAGVDLNSPEMSTPEMTRLLYLRERKDVIYDNLRDLNFEHKAGKITEQDFDSLRDSLEAEAAGVLSEIAQLERSN